MSKVYSPSSYAKKIQAKTLDYQTKRPRIKLFDPDAQLETETQQLSKKAKMRREEIINLIKLEQKDPNAIGKCGCIRSKCCINEMCFDHWKEQLEDDN